MFMLIRYTGSALQPVLNNMCVLCLLVQTVVGGVDLSDAALCDGVAAS